MILKALVAFALILLEVSGRKTRKPSDSFQLFMLAQSYPAAICQASKANVCKIPQNAKPWTIHGLWPNRYDGLHPQNCGGSKFNLTKLSSLEENLQVCWPNLVPKSPKTSLWKHEWKKHGTCAKSVPQTEDQYKYFSTTLWLYHQFNFSEALNAFGIKPSMTQKHTALNLRRALSSYFGANVQIRCVKDRKRKQWLLGDARICLTKGFLPTDCEKILPKENESEASEPGIVPRTMESREEAEMNAALARVNPCPAAGILYIPAP